MIDALFAAALAAVIGAMAIPQTLAGVERTRTVGAARYLAARLALARTQAVVRSANVAVLFATVGGTLVLATYQDGNGNGVRTREIGTGVDRPIGPPVRFADMFPRVALHLNDPTDISITTSALMSFSPIGTASSRTLYVNGRDGSRYAVRVLGATGRVRVLRYVVRTRAWIEVL